MFKKIGFVILVVFLGQVGFSQEKAVPTYELGEIVVTGTKIEKTVGNLPFSANVLSKDEISKKPAVTIDEVVRAIPGVHSIRPHPATHGVFVTMRGHALTKQVVALDGQPINDGFNGYVRWSVIPSPLMERVEVIRGPFSALYGPYGMAGVINFVPKTFMKENENELTMKMGSFGIHSGSLLYGITIKDRLSLVTFIDEKDVQGYVGDFVVIEPRTTLPTGATPTAVSGWERTSTPEDRLAYKIGDRGRQYSKEHRNVYLGLNYKLTDGSDISLSYLYGRQKHGFEGWKTYLKGATGLPASSGNISFNDGGTTYYMTLSELNFLDMEGRCGQDILNIAYSHKLRENVNIKAFTGLNTRVQKWTTPLTGATASGGPGRKGTPEGISNRFGVETKIELNKNTVVTGTELTMNSGSSKRERVSNWKDEETVTVLEEDAKGKAQITSIYLLNEFIREKERINIWLGGRYDSWKNYDGKTITPVKTTSFPDKTTSKFNPKLGILFTPKDFLSFRTSYGEGFRMPTVHELYRQMITPIAVSLGNPDLRPESNRCWDMGTEIKPSRWNIKAFKLNHFIDETKNLIYTKKWEALHPDTGAMVEHRQGQNAGKAKTTGYELEIEGSPIEIYKEINFSWFANCSFQNPKIVENPASTTTVGMYIPFVPREMYNTGATFERGPAFVTISMHRRGKVFIKDDNSDVVNNVAGSVDPFTVFDTKLGYKIVKDSTFSITVNNLFAKEYYSMHRQLAPGRSITGELTVKF